MSLAVDEAASPALAAAVRALQAGDTKLALWHANEACHAAPDDPRSHYAYAQAWSALGEYARAQRAFAEAVRLQPGWADAWVNLGITRYRQGDVEEAKTAMLQALQRDPDHAGAASNLAAFLRLTGGVELAERILGRLVAEGRSPAARLNLAAEHMQEGRPGEALALLAGPPPDDPAAARQWHLQRAMALLEKGDLAGCREALAAFEALGPVPAALRPLLLLRQIVLARAEGDLAGARALAQEMEAALGTMGPGAVPEHRIMGYYDLARLYSVWAAPEAAMRNWAAGHGLLAKSQPYDRAADQSLADRTIAAFSAARMAAGPRAANADPAPVFIVGMPRSGTTLCEQILAAHPMAHGAGERVTLPQTVAQLGGGPAMATLDAPTLDRASSAYLAELHGLAPDKDRIVDKLPGNYWHVGPAALLMPGARFIHCLRDPRDIGFSIFTFRFFGYHPYAHGLADLGFAITEQLRLMAHWRAVLPGAILPVRLDDWVHDFDGTLTRILAHVGLPYDAACARFYENTSRVRTVSREQVRQPVNAKGLGRWRPYEPWLTPLIQALQDAGALEDWA